MQLPEVHRKVNNVSTARNLEAKPEGKEELWPSYDDIRSVSIVSSGRTGTTALAHTLGRFPDIAYTPELKYFAYAMSSRRRFEPYDSEEAIERFFVHALGKVLKFNPDLKHRARGIREKFRTSLTRYPIVGSPPSEVYRHVFLFLAGQFANKDGSTIVLQTPDNLFYHRLIDRVLGRHRVQYIFMYRDPRNFFASAMRGNQRWYRKDITAIAHWNLAMSWGEQLLSRKSERCVAISQEDLLLSKQEVLDDLAEFLSVESVQLAHDAPIHPNTSFDNHPLSSATMDRYLNAMSAEEIAKVELLTQGHFQTYYPHEASSDGVSSGLPATTKLRLHLEHLIELTKLRLQIFLWRKGMGTLYFGMKAVAAKLRG